MSRELAASGPWELPVEGFEVLQITFAFPIDIVASANGGVSALIRVEGAFHFFEPSRGSPLQLNAADQSWEELSVLLCLRHDRIKSARATEEGQMCVEFSSGRSLSAGTSAQYENWEISGSHIAGSSFQLIALPGGGVAVFNH